jgi:hypothetical protein|tara:strand:+ start:1060 stop:1311 length:252 start_codon:yes stop_codon:yes gene_type:complete
MEAIQPKQAKEQLLKMIEDEAMDDVVSIIKGMALDKRKKIIQEFAAKKRRTNWPKSSGKSDWEHPKSRLSVTPSNNWNNLSPN